MAYSKEEIQSFKDNIIELLSNGESLKSILENNKEMPSRPIVYTWLNEDNANFDKEFLNNYVRAREDSADIDAEKIQELAEKTLKGTYDPQSARIALDAYKWSAGKKKPKKYGDKLDLTSGNEKIQQASIPLILSDGRTYEDLKNELKPE
tara:strand:+ start:6280 stop:6729 length:450 start_codon:yes stop_codon:yes gene_type:complete